MNLSFWIALMFWAFILGFWLGISFPRRDKNPIRSYNSTIDNGFDFYIGDKEYRNFLSYDGTTQEKE